MHLAKKAMSYKAKLLAMYDNKFYMRPSLRSEFLSDLEHKFIVSDREAVSYIDRNGEWLTHERT